MARKPKLHFKENAKGRWHWYVTGGNGKKVDQSAEGDMFPSLTHAQGNFIRATNARLKIVGFGALRWSNAYWLSLINLGFVVIHFYKKK